MATHVDPAAAAPAFPTEYRLLIDGEMVKLDKTFNVLNPATGELAGKCPDCDQEHVDAAVNAARRAFKTWSVTPLVDRKAAMKKAWDLVVPHIPKLAELMCKEQGKPKGGETPERQMVGATGELMMTGGLFEAGQNIEIPETLWKDMGSHEVVICRRPVGVTAGIAPWNFPILCMFQKVIPAVIYGNTFVGKPSPFTPLTDLAMFEIIKDAFPKGVVNCVVSDDRRFRAGEALVKHKKIEKVSFTGSVPTGKAIMQNCAADMKRCTLELGGNDAAIVREDCDPKEAAAGVFSGAFANSGQVCIAVKRAYVHEKIYDSFVDEITKAAQAAKFGDGMQADTDFGPLCNEMQLNRVSELVEDAKKSGAKVTTGGQRRAGKGFFYEPTILANVQEGVRIVDEEQFGPALPIIKYADDEDALDRANDSVYGLGGSVWSKNLEKANDIAARLRAGTVWVNQHLGYTGWAPFGGFKESGIGRENGDNLTTWTETQTFKRAKVQAA